MASFTDWLAAKFFVSEEDKQTHADVAAAQQRNNDRQYAEGKIGLLDYYGNAKDIANAGRDLQTFQDNNSSLFMTVPWWIWLTLLLAGFWYLGGFIWLKGILARRTS